MYRFCRFWPKIDENALFSANFRPKLANVSRFWRFWKKNVVFYALLVNWPLRNPRFNALFNKMRVKNKSSRGRRDKNAIHSPILGENWRKTTRFHRFWAKICKNDAFLRLFAAFWNPEPEKSRKNPWKRVVFANFGPKSIKTRCFPPIFSQNWRMYRVFGAF